MKLNYKRTILIGLAFMSILAFWQFYDQVIPYTLKYKFNLTDFNTNAIMAVDNVLAIFMLPFFGALSDRTHTRLGKRTPYILFGTVAAAILLVLLGLFEATSHFMGFIITLMAILVTMSIYRTPAVAYMPDVTEKPLRSKANAIINLVGYIGGIFATLVMMFMLKSKTSENGEKIYTSSLFPVFVIIAAFMVFCVIIMVLSINENKLLRETNIKDEDEDTPANQGKKLPRPVFKSLIFILLSVFLWFMAYNGVTTAFSRYCAEVLNADLSTSSSWLLTATISAIIAFVPLGFLSSKLGRKAMVLIGIIIMTVCYTAAFFIRSQTPVMYLLLGIIGIGWAAINVNSFPMVVEMSSGADVGKYTGIYYTFSMAAQITTPLLSGLIVDNFSFGYLCIFPYAVFFSALSFVTMLFVRHGDSKPQKKKSLLENFAQED